MGGTIELESEEGTGSTFRFEIPLTASIPTTAGESVSQRLAGLRALVVDDIPLNRRIFRGQADTVGIQVTEATDAEAALGELRRSADAGEAYDLVIIDHRMLGTSGVTLARWIRSISLPTSAKLILMSSSALRGEADAAVRDLFDAVLLKPAHRSDLMRCLTGLFDPQAAQPEPERSRLVESAEGHGKRILLAEDNLINQRIAVGYLRKAGYEVDTALDGVEAVTAVGAVDYALVLMDIQMPRCDGLQATKRIRALSSDKAAVPIVAMTAHAMAGSRAEFISCGMDDYIAKPIDPRAFLATVRRWAMGRESDGRVARPVVSAPAAKVIEESRISNLAELLPEAEFDALIDMWLTSTAAHVASVATLAAAGDLAALGFVAHDLVSTAGNFGACRLEDAARRLGQACKSGDVKAVNAIAAELAGDGEAAIKAVMDRFRRATAA